jgi:hypothetical protein
MDEARIAIVPYGTRYGRALHRLKLESLNWPLGRPAGLSGTVADLGPQDHLLLYPTSAAFLAARPGVRARVSLILAEPRSYHGRYYRLARLLRRRFFRILTYDRHLLAGLPNAVALAYGTTWIADWRALDLTKKADISLVASAKRKLEGHRLRHDIVAAARAEGIAMTVMGGGYAAFENKADGIAPFRFSVAIENSREHGYFTEKLLDCFMCLTVPIYWGAPDIADYFNPSGMILCQDRAEIMRAIRAAGPELYERMLPHVIENRERAEAFLDYEGNAARALAASLKDEAR